jgi:hypothetical protein
MAGAPPRVNRDGGPGIRHAQDEGYCPGLDPLVAATARTLMVENSCASRSLTIKWLTRSTTCGATPSTGSRHRPTAARLTRKLASFARHMSAALRSRLRSGMYGSLDTFSGQLVGTRSESPIDGCTTCPHLRTVDPSDRSADVGNPTTRRPASSITRAASPALAREESVEEHVDQGVGE